MALKVLYEDKFVVAVEKPQGIPVQNDKTNDDSLIEQVIKYVYRNEDSSSDKYLALINRIDRPVGGVVVFAKNQEVAKVLSMEISQQKTQKYYHAVVCGNIIEETGCIENYIKKLKTINMSKIVDKNDKDAKKAKLEFFVLDRVFSEKYGYLTLLKIKLYTGRHHQIRVQLSNYGYPIWGDNKYNKVFMKKKEFTYAALWASEYVFSNFKTSNSINVKSIPVEIEPFNLFNIG